MICWAKLRSRPCKAKIIAQDVPQVTGVPLDPSLFGVGLLDNKVIWCFIAPRGVWLTNVDKERGSI